MNTKPAPALDTNNVIDASQSFHAPALQQRHNTGVSLIDETAMAAMYRFAKMMAGSMVTVPQHLRGNEGDCMAIALQAQRWGMSPFVVAGKTHLVNGQLGYEAQLVASVVNTSSALSGRLHYEWFGPWEKIVGKFKMVESRTKKDDNGNPKKFMVPAWEPRDEEGLGVLVWGTLRGETEPRRLQILMTQARTRNSTLWTEDPKQQIAYLATKRWSRLYLPEVLLGVYDADEFATSTTFMGNVDMVDDTPAVPPALKAAAYEAADKGRAVFAAWWKALLPAQRNLLVNDLEDLQKHVVQRDAERTVDNVAAPAQPTSTSAPAAAPAEAPAEPKRARAPAPKPPAPTAPAAAPANTGAPVFTPEVVSQRLRDAKDLDALYIAADLISHVADKGAVAALEAFFEERQAELQP